jgi:hypothetical protein
LKTPNAAACRWNPDEATRLLQGFGLEPKRGAARLDARALAVTRIGPDIAPAQMAQSLNEKTGGCIFYQRSVTRIIGLLGFIPLRPEGLVALEADDFDGVDPPLQFVAAPGDLLAAVYGWVFVGSTPRAAATVISGMIAIRESLPLIPFYGRCATEEGRRVVTGRMGYVPVPGSRSGLVLNTPVNKELEVAA